MAAQHDLDYVEFGRNLADTLMRYARDRRDEDKKLIAALHHDFCVLRRAEIAFERGRDEPSSTR